MANLALTFDAIYDKVAEFLGWGISPSAAQIIKAKDIVYRGYRKFLYPINARTGKAHTWSFLIKHDVLTTDSGKWEYELPSDFSNRILYFEQDAASTYPPLNFIAYKNILRKRTLDSSTSYPYAFSIKTGRYDAEIGQRYELVFYPTPNSNYILHYAYSFDPVKITADTDLFVGGVRASDVILECALAIAELQEDDTIGIHNQVAEAEIQKMIQADVPILPDTAGRFIDRSIGIWPYYRYLEMIPYSDIYAAEA